VFTNFFKVKPTPETLVKSTLAILLLLCLLHLPYGYSQLIRFIAVIGFSILAYYEYERKNIPLVIVFVGLVLLFQPMVKVSLGREVWNIVDVVVAAGLIGSLLVYRKKHHN
jgi:hypothetical protein